MSTPPARPPRRLSRRAADRRLDRTGAGAGAGDALDAVLAAAAAPTGPGPLAGEDSASAAFRLAHAERVAAHSVSTPEGASLMSRISRKIVTAPLAVVAAGGLALTGGGVALAASQGALHVPFTGHDNRSTHAPAAPAPTNPGMSRGTATSGEEEPATAAATPTDEATTGAAEESAATTRPSATPSPSLVGLCRAYLAGAGEHNKMTNPAFSALTAAAGGIEQVESYCTELVPPRSHPVKPGHPVHPTHPAHPVKPTHPAHPVKPTHPAHPTKPTHPAHPTKPTQAATPERGNSAAAQAEKPAHPAKPTQAAGAGGSTR